MLDRLFVRSQARVAALALLLLPAAAAFAQAAETDHMKNLLDHAKERFTAADTDHDGMLTKAEAQKGMPFVAKHFDDIDAAKAGKVSLADITKYMEERRAKLNAEPKTETKADK
jgi:Ca2+-binding EF-hand superfamily protein